jgi:hypothetical protein
MLLKIDVFASSREYSTYSQQVLRGQDPQEGTIALFPIPQPLGRDNRSCPRCEIISTYFPHNAGHDKSVAKFGFTIS